MAARDAVLKHRFGLTIRLPQVLLLHRLVNPFLGPNSNMRAVDSDKYLYFYRVDARQTMLTGVSLISRVNANRYCWYYQNHR
jgi:hypothetical protein